MGWRDADDERDDLEFPDLYGDRGVDSLTVPCPHCFHTLYNDAERCPGCGRFLGPTDYVLSPIPWWAACGVLISLILILTWFVR